MKSLEEVLDDMAERWPSSIVAREEIDKFSGGLLTPKYMANLDSRGLGPVGLIQSGRKVAYPIRPSLLPWMKSRSKILS